MLTRSATHISTLCQEIPRNEPRLDSMMFIKHNTPNWIEPADMGFEAAPVWHDDANMITTDLAKVFLQNILGKSKASRGELKREMDAKRKKVNDLRAVRQGIRDGRDKRDEVNHVQVLFALQEDLHEAERRYMAAEAEILTITSVVGDIDQGAKNHNFRGQTFKIPTNCDLCGERIWGLSAKGFDCRDCGYTCHTKCELKVPPDCPGELSKEDRKKVKAERQAATASVHRSVSTSTSQNGNGNGSHDPPPGVAEMAGGGLSRSNTMNSLSSGYATSAHRSISQTTIPRIAEADGSSAAPQPVASTKPVIGGGRKRIVAPPPTSYVSASPPSGAGEDSGGTRGRMSYPYTASGEGEISIDEGAELTIVESDGKSPDPRHQPPTNSRTC